MFKKILIWIEENIIIAITLIALTVISSYVINFSNFSFCHLNFSTKNDDWGTFGDYIGGVLNPIIAFCALYWIVKTYNLQKIELSKTEEALKNQTKLAALTALLNAKLMQIDSLKTQVIAWQAEKSNILVSRHTDEQASNAERKSLLESWIETNNDKIKTLMDEVTKRENDIKAIGGL